MLPLVGLWQDHSMVCLIVLTMSERMNELFIYYGLGLIARSAGSVASAFVHGVLHRETENGNRNKMMGFCQKVVGKLFVCSKVGGICISGRYGQV